MKKFALLFICSLLLSNLSAKDTYTDRYVQLRKKSDDSFLMVERIKKKEIQKQVAQQDDHQIGELLKQAKEMFFVMDEMTTRTSPELILLNSDYETLASMNIEDIALSVLANYDGDKVTEMVVILNDDANITMFGNIVFRKPVALEDYIEIESFNPMKLFAYNSDDDEALIQFKYSQTFSMTTGGSEPDLEGDYILSKVEKDGKFGIKHSYATKAYLIEPRYQEDELVLYGSNPGNTYIGIFSNDGSIHKIRDKYGLIIAWGYEITPVTLPGSDEIACFILKHAENDYALYECPEKYELIQAGSPETGDCALRPNSEHRIFGCTSIEDKGNGTFLCSMPDGSTENITIERLKR